eukprot:1685847-Amphidinium_carterae.1
MLKCHPVMRKRLAKHTESHLIVFFFLAFGVTCDLPWHGVQPRNLRVPSYLRYDARTSLLIGQALLGLKVSWLQVARPRCRTPERRFASSNVADFVTNLDCLDAFLRAFCEHTIDYLKPRLNTRQRTNEVLAPIIAKELLEKSKWWAQILMLRDDCSCLQANICMQASDH